MFSQHCFSIFKINNHKEWSFVPLIISSILTMYCGLFWGNGSPLHYSLSGGCKESDMTEHIQFSLMHSFVVMCSINLTSLIYNVWKKEWLILPQRDTKVSWKWHECFKHKSMYGRPRHMKREQGQEQTTEVQSVGEDERISLVALQHNVCLRQRPAEGRNSVC